MTEQDRKAIEALRLDRSKLTLADAATAVSLIAQHDRWALSPKQWGLVHVLARRASGGLARPAVTPIGDLSAIQALFDRAATRLQQPTILMGDGTGAEYRLKPSRKRPGSIDVTTPDRRGWFGRIDAGGGFEPSFRTPTPPMLPIALRAFALDPARVAGAHARKTGRCVFCGLAIGDGADPRARAVGYGEVCAGNWEQPWPTKAEAEASNAQWLAAGAA